MGIPGIPEFLWSPGWVGTEHMGPAPGIVKGNRAGCGLIYKVREKPSDLTAAPIHHCLNNRHSYLIE